MTTLSGVLSEFREAATSHRDLGDKFERLFAGYLTAEPYYRDRFSDVWMWSEWPGRGKQPDTGIDLVAKERATGEYCAIQCKFFDPEHRLEKADIDSFFTASGKHPFTSRIIVSTTDHWSKHAEEALNQQRVPVSRVRLQDLEDSAVDWSRFSLSRPDQMRLKPKKKLRPHQKKALSDVLAGLATADRGKLIMACGTGKTFTALKIAEALAPAGHPPRILYLVPSIALLSQSLLEWSAQAELPLHCFAVCSDVAVGRKSDSEDVRVHDLPFPATTDARKLAAQMRAMARKESLTVVFSTYQSIATIAQAQAKFDVPAFDLAICDEAHRTTGVTLADADESHFVRIHDAKYVRAHKRLYMTATPRIYADAAKGKAQEAQATVCSMDDETLYGKELHRLGFGESVAAGLLADYKVMVLAVDEKFVSKTFQKQLAVDGELNLDDVVRITGCWNGLGKRMARAAVANEGASGTDGSDPEPMRRAVAFSRTIADSKRIADLFAQVVERYAEQARAAGSAGEFLRCQADHVDGTMNALERARTLDWLKADTGADGALCRILSNARCLSEGVDVPALDAVLFLNPRNSVVDVVQSVGRVMRSSPGKRYGYIILPVGIPADVAPEVALQDSQKYKIVWQVLQALRAHDDRFNATVNQIELNKARPDSIQVIGVGRFGDSDGDGGAPGPGVREAHPQYRLDLPHLEEWRDAIFAKIVLKCGDRRYWEDWAKNVADIAERHITRIKALLESADAKPRKAFERFLAGLRSNLNPSVSEADAIEMLAQHLITQPVFDALFEGHAFTDRNLSIPHNYLRRNGPGIL
ncbi:MAG: DEAD/DEAH box helicase family protein [Steroidobacteraceae bacterium]